MNQTTARAFVAILLWPGIMGKLILLKNAAYQLPPPQIGCVSWGDTHWAVVLAPFDRGREGPTHLPSNTGYCLCLEEQKLTEEEAFFGEAKKTIIAARSILQWMKCAGLAMFEPQVASLRVWVVISVCIAALLPGSASFSHCERSRRYLQCICRSVRLLLMGDGKARHICPPTLVIVYA